MMQKTINAAIVGAGHRSLIYGDYALENPDRIRICAVAEPNPDRMRQAAGLFRLQEQDCYPNADALYASGIPVDLVINGTMDRYHVETTLPALRAGYNVLLEKPICATREELKLLVDEARKSNSRVMVCHVLRYASFYQEIKKRLAAGEIGRIINVRSEENISYHHMAACYVRGRWARRDQCGSSILLAKCSHDIDLISWYLSDVAPVYAASYGGIKTFCPEGAPKGAGTRCLVDCGIEPECPYSARNNYLTKNRWTPYVFGDREKQGGLSLEEKIESLKTDNPYGRCVYHCDNNVADHQTAMFQFEDGTVATHTLNVSPKACRTVHIVGTKGEICGTMENNYFIVRRHCLASDCDYTEQRVDISVDAADRHGGGDYNLMEDCVNVLSGKEPSISCTDLEDSIHGHLMVFAADEAMESGAGVPIETI